MAERALMILTEFNLYSGSLVFVVCLLLLSFLSGEFRRGVKVPLQILAAVWIVLFGYRVYTGDDLYVAITTPSQSAIEAAKHKKVMIDGREVLYNKETGEIVKKK